MTDEDTPQVSACKVSDEFSDAVSDITLPRSTLPTNSLLLLTATLCDSVSPSLEKRTLELLPGSQSASIARNRREKDRRLRILVRLLLAEGLRLLEGMTLAASLERLDWDDKGRPVIRESGWECSFSHSHKLALCLIGPGHIYGRLGVDAERIHPLSLADVAAAFCREEQESITGDPDCQNRLFAFWTRKEAALKVLGKGFLQEPSTVNMLSPWPIPSLQNLWSQNITLAKHPEYAVALAAENGSPKSTYCLSPFSLDITARTPRDLLLSL